VSKQVCGNPTAPSKKLTPTRIGCKGELMVQKLLLEIGYHVYTPVIDEVGIDLVCQSPTRLHQFYRLQVKTIEENKSNTSLNLRCGQTDNIDVVCAYYEPIGVAFVPVQEIIANSKAKSRHSVNLALYTAENNQQKDRQYFYQYMRFPEFQ